MSKPDGVYRHLVLCGNDKRASWVNDQGVAQGVDRNMTVVKQVEPKPAPAAPPPAATPSVSPRERIAIDVGVEDLADVIESLRQETASMKKQLFGFCENVAKLTDVMRQVGQSNQTALLDAGTMMVEEFSRVLRMAAQSSMEVPAAQHLQEPEPGNIVAMPVSLPQQDAKPGHQATIINFEYLGGRPARHSVVRLARDPAVQKIIVGGNIPRTNGRVIEGWIEYKKDGQHGELICVCNDHESAVELRVFLALGADSSKVDGLRFPEKRA